MANEWGVEPVGTSEEWGVDPVGAPKPVSATSPAEKPSILRRGVGLVGGVAAELPQIAYEGAVAPLNALYRGIGHAARTIPAFLGAAYGGASLEEAAALADEERRAVAQGNMLPPTIGGGSWLGRGVGSAANKLVDLGVVSPETIQGIGDLTALGGMRVTGPSIPQQIRTLPAVMRQKFPSAQARAGELLAKAEETLPPTTPQGARAAVQTALRQDQLTEAQKGLGVARLPETASPNIRRQQLAAERARQSGNVKESEVQLAERATAEAVAGLNRIVPSEKIDPARLDFVNKKIESHNTARTAMADLSTKSARERASQAAEDSALAELGRLESIIPATPRVDRYAVGVSLLSRLRGKGGDVDTGVSAVRKVFNKEYEAFDAQSAAVHSSAELAGAIKSSADVSTERGRVLRGYVDEAQKVESRLGENVIGGEGQDISRFPEALTLKQFRGVKGEFARAAKIARDAGDHPAATELEHISNIARQGEMEAVKNLGPEATAKYNDLSNAYRNVFIRAFREGHGGRILAQGKEVSGSKLPPANIYPSLMQFKNVHDFIAALGAEKAAQTGRPITAMGEAELQSLGRPEAAVIVRPYVESTLATLYKDAGGGVKGSTAITRYLQKNSEALGAYGLDFGALKTAATKYNETMVRMTKAKTAVAKDVVTDVIPTADPTKLGRYVLDSASPASAYKNLVGVSSDPIWRASINTLVKDELRARIDKGMDVFGDAKTRGAMEAVFSKPQIKALQQYHTIIKQLKEPPVRFKGEDIAEHKLEKAIGVAQAFPVGFGTAYIGKYLAKFAAKLKIIGDDEAAWGFIDDALIDPDKAKTLVGAYKGHKAAGEKLKADLAAERKTFTALSKVHAPKILERAVSGAVSSAGAKPLSDMPDEELVAQ